MRWRSWGLPSLLCLHALETRLQFFFHGWFDQVQQGLFVDHSSLEEVESHLSVVLHEDGGVAVSIHFHCKVTGELLCNKRVALRVFEPCIVIKLHTFEV